jgi:hypothetical protein
MNILTLGDENFTKELYTIKKDIHFTNIISNRLTSTMKNKLIECSIKNNKNIALYPHKKLKDFTFYKNFDWSKIKPLNKDLIEKMSFCEAETLKMYERIKSLKPSIYENRKKHYMNTLRYFNDLLDKKSIDVFIRYSVPHMGYDNVIYHLCKLKGIEVYMVYFYHPNFAYFARDIKNHIPDYNIETEREDFIYKNLELVANEYFHKKELTYKPTIVPPVARIQRKQRLLLRRNKLLLEQYKNMSIQPKFDGKYIYFPLHYQYEATTCPMGGVFVDQILALEILSRSGFKVYVKEHPRISKNRNIEFYNKINKLKNVYLVPIETNNYQLIENSFCVATITGTAGWEGILKGKCALLFGNIFYQYCDYVFNVGSVEEVKKAINEIKNIKYDKAYILRFLKGLENFFFPLDYKSIAENFSKELSKNDNRN